MGRPAELHNGPAILNERGETRELITYSKKGQVAVEEHGNEQK